jgi:hypothetical protein
VSVCLPSNDSVKISCTLVGEFELEDVTSCSPCKVVVRIVQHTPGTGVGGFSKQT